MYWLSTNYQWVVAIVLMPIILLLLKRWADSPKKAAGPTQAALSAEGSSLSNSPVASGSGNIQNVIVPVNVNIGQPAPATRPRESVPTVPSPKPNITFVESQSIEAHQGINDSRLHKSPSGLGDFRLAVVCFRNDAIVGQAVAEPELKAHIIYRDRSGKEVTDSAAGLWLGQYGEGTAFTVGHKKCLVVFLLSRQTTLMKVWNETYTTSDSWMAGGPLFRIRQEALSDGIASVTISLLAEETCVLRAEFNIEERHNNGLPELTLHSISGG